MSVRGPFLQLALNIQAVDAHSVQRSYARIEVRDILVRSMNALLAPSFYKLNPVIIIIVLSNKND